MYDGERIHENDTPESLGIKDGDAIEVFAMMTGGGKPQKKHIFGDSSKILKALASHSDSEDSDSILSDENEEEIKKSDNEQNLTSKETLLPTEKLREIRTNLSVTFVGSVGLKSSIEDKEILSLRN